MALHLDRKTLENMKRVDLQKLCKDHGIKANLKSEALVDLLLDTMQPRTRPVPDTQARRSASIRVVSRSTIDSRPRGMSGSSVIIHDTDDEEETAAEGVGRPTLAGGSGARAITRSLSVPKTPRGKVSRSIKPSEAPIQEEEEPTEAEGLYFDLDTAPRVLILDPHKAAVAGPSGTQHDLGLPQGSLFGGEGASSSRIPEESNHYTDAIMQPLKQQMQSLQAELQQLTLQVADIQTLKTQLSGLTSEVERLRSETSRIAQLEAEIETLKEAAFAGAISSSPRQSAKSAGKARAIDQHSSPPTIISPMEVDDQPSEPTVQGGKTANPSTAGLSQSLLGKRLRDSDDSPGTGAADAGKTGEKELEQGVIRPTKKRAKLSPKVPGGLRSSSHESPPLEDTAPAPAPSRPAFTVFSGPEEQELLETYSDPPPNLSDYLDLPPAGFAPPVGNGNGHGPVTATANANENVQQATTTPFTFTFSHPMFPPVTSTPVGPYGETMPSFIYPEPPISPTPGATTSPIGGYIDRGGRRERNDLFHPLGPPRRPRSAATQASRPQSSESPGAEGTVNPAALMRTPSLATVPELGAEPTPISSTEVGHGLGLTALPLPPDTPAAPMKRTMYGTELEADTRFGDFGVEGVATGFWTGRAPRF
ncbi:hypothetical protein POSPLADRAFT_1127893 [Postia placenta MAD-698-R-SB12]|uniref:Uncharacterized protein n=1 Tax=Postia placenta MAD-698-R-SB12 TaxID=670580 RepID=A0A1X6NGC2_9APHY|nr:hypothetical protein POSPLADRAFT_1127893 [Postia placenta MAD-698-R-SB12]OSX67688.1 hypothetical protein POSPLADRAFT_1127893 [Postia placenta MAD-698-R-SB12]